MVKYISKRRRKYIVARDLINVEISDTQRYKTLGNAVTVSVIEAVMESLRRHIG